MRRAHALDRRWSNFTRVLSERVATWSRRRHGPDTGTVIVNRRRVYILPTPLGATYGLMLVFMLLAGLNYNNNLVLAFTFLLAGVGWITLHRCHHNLAGLVVSPAGERPAHAGTRVAFGFRLETRSARHDLVVSAAGTTMPAVSLAPDEAKTTEVWLQTQRRGQLILDRLRIESTYPLGLFRTWTWLHPERGCLVYPKPLPTASYRSPPTGRGMRESGVSRGGNADLSDLRPFRPGDVPRRIAWKVWARNDALVTRDFVGGESEPPLFDLAATPGADLEEKLSRLTRLVLDARTRGEVWALKVDGEQLPPDGGDTHLARSLALLATYALPPIVKS
jgi:uncharacterized protein (DUF58 family)